MIWTARRSEIECELSWWSSMTTARRAWSAGQLEEADKGANYQTEDKAEIHERLNFGRTVLPRHFA